MTLHAEIAALKQRLVKAELGRDAWRASGTQEKYLEAYTTVQALEMQLDQLERAARRPIAHPADIGLLTASPAESPDHRERLMAELCIRYNGRSYQYRGFRYDRLADAVNYARLDRSRPFGDAAPADAAPLEEVHAPSETERELMRALAITFEDGIFCLREYRYDRLADAVAYANLRPMQ